MLSIIQLIVRAAQLIFVVVVLGLTATLIHDKFDGYPGGEKQSRSLPALTGYTMFVACYGMVAVLVGFVAAFVDSLSGFIMAAIDGLAVLFYLAGAIAVAVKTGVASCDPGLPDDKLLPSRLWQNSMIVDGWYDGVLWLEPYSGFVSRCRITQALCAFEFFALACFIGSLALDLMGGGGGGFRRKNGGGNNFV